MVVLRNCFILQLKMSPQLSTSEAPLFNASELVHDPRTPSMLGAVAMPKNIVEAYRCVSLPDQLVIERYAYSFTTIEVDKNGNDISLNQYSHQN